MAHQFLVTTDSTIFDYLDRELYEKSPSVAAARTMYQVAHRLSQLLIESYNNQNKNNGLTEKIHQLLSHAVALCSNGNDITVEAFEFPLVSSMSVLKTHMLLV